ncbi:glycosyl hydrolase family 61-domain-containing protein [Aspergillus heterothallicus]
MSLIQLIAILGAAGSALGHGYVTSIDVDGTSYGGYLIDTYYYEDNPPEIIAWSTTATDTGYVAPTAYGDSDIICHRGAEPGALSAEIAPGGSVTMYWSTWPTDHHGPVLSYLAKCDGDCASVDKTTLEFFKIAEGGLIDNSEVPGTWASDELIAANYSSTFTIPSDIASGNYVLRHEIIALHGAEALDGAQNYPQCVNLKVTGSGTATPAGTLGTELYKDTDAGIYVDIWNSLSSYDIPGPALYTAGGSSDTSSSASSSATTTTTTTTTTVASASTTSSTITSSSTEPTTTTTTTTTTTALTNPQNNNQVATSTQDPLPTSTVTPDPTSSLTSKPTPPSNEPEPSLQAPVPSTSQDAIPPTETGSAPSSVAPGPSTPTQTPGADTGNNENNEHGHHGHYGKGQGKGGRGRPHFFVTDRQHARDLTL